MTSVYYKNSVGAIIVFDLERPETLETCLKWKDDITSRVGVSVENYPCILLANKVLFFYWLILF
jgi:GTPase SAR1 family protein